MVPIAVIKASSAQLWQKYSQILHRHPIVTKSLISGALFLGGDILCQHFELRGSAPTDTDRAVQMGIFGTFVNGPVMHHWYKTLDRLIPGSGRAVLIKKVAMDQIFFAPVFYGLFFSSAALMKDSVRMDRVKHMFNKDVQVEPFSFQTTKETMSNMFKHAFAPTLTMDWRVWPISNAINFSVIPQQHRVTFGNVVSVIWNGYLSAAANKPDTVPDVLHPSKQEIQHHRLKYLRNVERLMV